MKKFMLVPPQTLPSPLTRKLSQLDEEMKTILDSQSLSEFEKARAYSEVLDKYLDVKRRLQQPTTIPIVDQKPSHVQQDEKQSIDLNVIPQQYRARAKNLLSHIEKQTDLDWNNKGELIVQGKPLIGSHIADLLDDTVRTKPRSATSEPIGSNTFLDGLRKSNVPQALIGNKNRFKRAHTPERNSPAPSTHRPRKSRIDTTKHKWEPIRT